MSDKFSSKMGPRAQGRALAGRTEKLVEKVDMIEAGANRLFQEQANRVSALEETVLALVQTVGIDEIQAAIIDQRKMNGEKRVADETAALDEAVKDGYVLPIDAVDETAFIVGVEHDKGGNLLAYGAQQCPFTQLPEAFKPLLLGKKVGESIETPTGGKFELTGVYKLDEAKRDEVMKAKQEAAAKAAAEVPTEAPAAPAAEAPAETAEQTA
jgi:hypothetical protein